MKSSVAVTAIRFYWPARSREGVGSMERYDSVELGAWAMPLPEMHAAGPQGSPGAAAPGAFWELFCGEKFPAGGKQGLRCLSTCGQHISHAPVVGVDYISARIRFRFAGSLIQTAVAYGRIYNAPLRRRRRSGSANSLAQPPHPPREAAKTARTRNARYLR